MYASASTSTPARIPGHVALAGLRGSRDEGAGRPPRPTARPVELVDTAGLESLRGPWLDLWRRSATATPFQAPGCVLAWARRYAPDRTVAVVVREKGRLVALAPAFTWNGAVLLAATGPTDYGDVLVEPGREDLADLLLEGLAALAEARGCDRIELHQLQPRSLLLRAGLPLGWRQARAPGDVCPVALVEGETGLDGVPQARRRKFEAARRRAERDGPPAIFETATAASLDAAIQDLLRLHGARWTSRGEPGVLSDPLMRDFVVSALPDLQSEGVLRLHTLRLGDETAAVLLALHDARSAHLYLSGLDPDVLRFAPGARLLAYAFGQAAAEGLREVHFLRGQEPYKYAWGALDRPIWRRTLYRAA